ncbi:MAG: hypothetical protein PHS59_10040 [Paludibacter sp.]|nr:hypothetical protein [Paludibacter sp.]
MNRKLIVTLLKKDIQELDMITDGFMEMNEYPKAIIQLAQRKVVDIQSYIKQLEEIKTLTEPTVEITESDSIPIEDESSHPVTEEIIQDEPPIEIETSEEIVETNEESLEIEIVESETEEIVDEVTPEFVTPESESYELKEVTEVKTSTTTETKTTVEDTKKTILAEKINAHIPSRNDSMSKTDNSLSSTLANKKVDDIKQAINIGDRFRFQRELFRGNGEDMNKTLSYINQLATLPEVQSFLDSKYGWDAENTTVEDFYQIVKRRFI